jgi:DNA gyrase subunit B
LIRRHRDENGRLPTYRAVVYRPGETKTTEYFGYSDEEFEQLINEEQQHVGEVKVIEAGAGLSIGSNGDEPEHRIVRSDLSECCVLEATIAHLETYHLTMEDYFAERVEQVDGTLPPARFLLRRGDKTIELDNLANLIEEVRNLGGGGVEVKRFKGLGEMNGEELWDTTMNPEKRGLLKVVVSDEADDPEQLDLDAQEANRIFAILMGDDVEARRTFIEENAEHVKNLDV